MHRTMDTPTVVILLVVALFILLAILKKVGRVAARVSSPCAGCRCCGFANCRGLRSARPRRSTRAAAGRGAQALKSRSANSVPTDMRSESISQSASK
jgi:hypothetical protein